MEKIKEEIVQRTSRTHEFYCDNCGEFLGSTIEYDDGYAPEINNYIASINIPLDCNHGIGAKSAYYSLNKHYCNSCLNDFISKIHNVLINFGFTVN